MNPSDSFQKYLNTIRIISYICIGIFVVSVVMGTGNILFGDTSGWFSDEDDSYEVYGGEVYEPGSYDGYEDDFILPGSDERFVDNWEVDELSLDETQTAINEIYARHGRDFKGEPEHSYFYSFEWYTPYYSGDEFDDDWFNEYEKANLDLLIEHRAELRD